MSRERNLSAIDRLRLHLAKTSDRSNEWMKDDEGDAGKLQGGQITSGIHEMLKGNQPRATMTLYRWMFEECSMPMPATDQIHLRGHRKGLVYCDNVVERKGYPFFCEFPRDGEVNHYIVFVNKIPLTKRKVIYARPSYKSIAEQVLYCRDNIHYAVVTGPMGIGKSVFALYLFGACIKKQRRVLFARKRLSIYFDGRDFLQCVKLPAASNCEFWAPNLMCLVDPDDSFDLLGPTVNESSSVLVSTEGNDLIDKF